jgi:membrane associated rhomboid family serine protease
MTPLTVNALQEPWSLWTCHLAHHDWQHAADNALALSIPLLLAQRQDRGRTLLWLFLLAPLLSLALLPSLQGETYGGFSGLGCAAWTLVGLQLLFREETLPVGGMMLALLGLKFAVEGMTGSGLLAHHGRWQTLSDSHLYGMLLGLGAGLLDESFRRFERKVRCCTSRSLRRLVTIPR